MSPLRNERLDAFGAAVEPGAEANQEAASALTPAPKPAVFAADELYAVSDLHIGGAAGGQIFAQGAELAALIDLLRERPAGCRVALVINGDIVDFLAEKQDAQSYLKARAAVSILQRIFADGSFAMVWAALARFVRTANRTLVLCLGNHDVELALPVAQKYVSQQLGGDDPKAHDRIWWATDGRGFECRVGAARVFCTHGNEVDPWNIVDYQQLARIAAAQAANQELPTWDPNAGTQLVIDIMNEVKQRYPFVDLLKPETEIVPPMIVSLEPRFVGRLRELGSILFRRIRGSLRTGLLGGSDSADGPDDAAAKEEFVRRLVLGKQGQPRRASALLADSFLKQMEADFKAGRRPQEFLQSEPGMLGLGQFAWDTLVKRPPAEALREAIRDWLRNDRTFAFTTPDDTFTRLDEKLDPAYDFVLAGHTHLARALPRKNGRGYYFNSGTWSRLIQLTEATLDSDEHFAPAYTALVDGSMAALDRAQDLVLRRPTVIRIVGDGQQAVGELLRVVMQAGKAELRLEAGTTSERR